MPGVNLPGGGSYGANLAKRLEHRDSSGGGDSSSGGGSSGGSMGLGGALMVIGFILLVSKQGGWAVLCWVASAVCLIFFRK